MCGPKASSWYYSHVNHSHCKDVHLYALTRLTKNLFVLFAAFSRIPNASYGPHQRLLSMNRGVTRLLSALFYNIIRLCSVIIVQHRLVYKSLFCTRSVLSTMCSSSTGEEGDTGRPRPIHISRRKSADIRRFLSLR